MGKNRIKFNICGKEYEMSGDRAVSVTFK